MCFTNVWGVNVAAFTPDFSTLTREELGIDPQSTQWTVRHRSVRENTAFFTLIVNGCDCTSSVGAGTSRPGAGEIPLDSWIAWLSRLHDTRFISTLLLCRAVISDDVAGTIRPARTRVLAATEVTADDLSRVRENELLVMTFPGA